MDQNKTPFRFMLITTFSIFLAEALIMVVLSRFPPLGPLKTVFLDSLMIVLMVFPALYHWFFRPLVDHIAARDLARRDLKKSEANLLKAQRLSQVGSWEWDLRDGSLRISDEMARIYQIPSGQIENDPQNHIVKAVHTSDIETFRAAIKHLRRGRPWRRLLYRIRVKNDDICWILAPPPGDKILRRAGAS